MKFEKFLSVVSESVKEVNLNRILDKISRMVDLTPGEKKFLDNYEKVYDRDYHMISKESVVKIIDNLKKSGREIICDLHDRNGSIGLEILEIDNNFQDEVCSLHLKGGDKFKLNDNFLYNIIWDSEKGIYHLEKDSEYFEKIPVK